VTGGVLGCQVWWARPRDDPALRSLLDAGERERAGRFGLAGDRARFVAGRALARLVLAGLTGLAPRELALTSRCAFCGGPHGKPRLAGAAAAGGPEVSFSVAHSGDRVVVAAARGAELGVDVEQDAGPSRDRLARRVLTPAERAALAALPPGRRRGGFAVCWCRKEAVLKADGRGLAVPMSALTVSPPGTAAALLAWRDGPAGPGARLADLHPGPGYAACLAVLTARPVRVTEHAAAGWLLPQAGQLDDAPAQGAGGRDRGREHADHGARGGDRADLRPRQRDGEAADQAGQGEPLDQQHA
jgi:phosphopantetheinyl transferase